MTYCHISRQIAQHAIDCDECPQCEECGSYNTEVKPTRLSGGTIIECLECGHIELNEPDF